VSGRRSLPELLASVEGRLHTANRQWNPVSPDQCDDCRRALDRAIQELEEVRTEAARTPQVPLDRLERRLQQIRLQTEQVSWKVDAATAFCRGMLRTIGQECGPSLATDISACSGGERRT
jgi:hypothetical protein